MKRRIDQRSHNGWFLGGQCAPLYNSGLAHPSTVLFHCGIQLFFLQHRRLCHSHMLWNRRISRKDWYSEHLDNMGIFPNSSSLGSLESLSQVIHCMLTIGDYLVRHGSRL